MISGHFSLFPNGHSPELNPLQGFGLMADKGVHGGGTLGRELEMTTAVALSALIVEDAARFRRLFKELLLDRYPSMRVAEAGDAEEAMGKIEASAPDLVFMDIGLPGMNGIQLTKHIKTQHPEMKIVVVTNLGDPDFQAAAIADGAVAFFSKDSLDGEAFTTTMDSLTSEIRNQQISGPHGSDRGLISPTC
jgi:CheY-like chemotaxis protein